MAQLIKLSICRGHAFRTSFSKIGSLRALTQAPFMALTATASGATQSAITEALKLVEPAVVSLSLNRHNIFLSVSTIRSMSNDFAGIVHMLKTRAPKILVYTLTKNVTCKVYDVLSKAIQNKHCVSMYHASLTPATKSHIHMAFQSGTLRCLVSTIAFGMGMDIRDVELVVMYGAPDNMNNLHQVICIILYHIHSHSYSLL